MEPLATIRPGWEIALQATEGEKSGQSLTASASEMPSWSRLQ